MAQVQELQLSVTPEVSAYGTKLEKEVNKKLLCKSMGVGLQNANLSWTSSSSGTKGFVTWIKNVGVCFVNYFPRGGARKQRKHHPVFTFEMDASEGRSFRVENGFVAPFL